MLWRERSDKRHTRNCTTPILILMPTTRCTVTLLYLTDPKPKTIGRDTLPTPSTFRLPIEGGVVCAVQYPHRQMLHTAYYFKSLRPENLHDSAVDCLMDARDGSSPYPGLGSGLLWRMISLCPSTGQIDRSTESAVLLKRLFIRCSEREGRRKRITNDLRLAAGILRRRYSRGS